MKMSKVALGLVTALTGLAVAPTVLANPVEGFEYHGYFRAGVLMSAENDFKRSNFAGQKETLGRLGIEADNNFSAQFANTWTWDEDKSFKINLGFGTIDEEAGISTSAEAKGAGIDNGYVEFTGMSSSGVVWGGGREYGKVDNYIFMTDFFYSDMSGIGAGIVRYEIGESLWDLAYIASDRSDSEFDRWNDDSAVIGNNTTNLNNLLHALHIGVSYGDVRLSALVKGMPDNWDKEGNEWAESGFDLTFTYTMHSFFGLPGNGDSKLIVQGGKGLGAGNLLGGTITGYNAYGPGSLAQGQHNDWGDAGDATYLITHLEDDDTSGRVLLWGRYTFDNGLSLFPSVQGQYNHMAEGDARAESDYNYWVSAMVRPTMPISEYFYLQGELGYVYNNWGGSSWTQSKFTIAPTFIMATPYGVAPEIRFLASYLPESWTNEVDQPDGSTKLESDFIVGIQADVWW
ncbi:maltoporin [Vibrio breoganii]|uniref:Maltoporin n=1 Tax=Vibrio breoganii TaxID=553239 RepID=A0AAN0XVK6_9VIBR|nr:carbohydrate porin [Vibrio breoganii]ANO33386.1 maltoporin [Vibrio breoganii]MDN3716248.1 carbohydrate porin [Vibrio breoganii]OED86865.1 maltoporin [Vibrio breoganii ZF-55]PMG82776.1 maltoporin [Vibrio breoganii]PMK47094.1 maltoporin [Vibrio breoganii]